MYTSRLVIIAAGIGSRLHPTVTAKPLVRLAGLTLLERAMVAGQEAGFDDLVVVTGHDDQRVAQEALDVSRRRGLRVAVVHNARYREGNGLSVLAAKEILGNRPFALAMADHVFAPALLRRLRLTAVEPNEVVVVVDRSLGRAAGVDAADAMKVRLVADRVDSIGKTLVDYDAFDVGAFVCSPAVLNAIEKSVASGDTSLAAAVQLLAATGQAHAMLLESDDWWFDVDTPADHRRGNRYLVRSTGKTLDGVVATRLNRAISQRLVTPALLRFIPSVTPNQVTIAALIIAAAATVALVAHAPLIAALLIMVASVLDGSDGEIARLAHRASRFGAFFDAVVDRASDGLLFTGAAIFLATSTELAGSLGSAQVAIVIALVGLAAVGHLLVSYTTAKAAVDLRHTYHGAVLAGGRGRDLRLLILTLGAAGAAVHPASLLFSIGVIAALCAWIVGSRLRASWWADGPGARYMGVRAVALDFDGTVADSMGPLATTASRLLSREFGTPLDEAMNRYLATAGDDFRTQLELIAPSQARLDEISAEFEAAKDRLMVDVRPFGDAKSALQRVGRAGVPALVCSSTRAELVQAFCRRFGLAELVGAVEGWRPDHPKAAQLGAWCRAIGVAPDATLFVGDALRDAAIARAAGVRFVGIARPGHPDAFAGSGIHVVTSLTELAQQIVTASRAPVVTGSAAAVKPTTRVASAAAPAVALAVGLTAGVGDPGAHGRVTPEG